MSKKESVVLETVLEDLKRPNEAGDQITPVKPLEYGEDDVYNSLYSALKSEEDSSNKINKNKE